MNDQNSSANQNDKQFDGSGTVNKVSEIPSDYLREEESARDSGVTGRE